MKADHIRVNLISFPKVLGRHTCLTEEIKFQLDVFKTAGLD